MCPAEYPRAHLFEKGRGALMENSLDCTENGFKLQATVYCVYLSVFV